MRVKKTQKMMNLNKQVKRLALEMRQLELISVDQHLEIEPKVVLVVLV